MRERFLSLVVGAVSRMLVRRDRRSGAVERMMNAFPFADGRLAIRSGERRLSAVYVSAGEDTPAVLICHGIGELVEYWAGVQWMLKGLGVSSLAFNYSGYGESSGSVSAANCEEDAKAAYAELAERGHRAVFLLGFSLGTGVSCAIADEVPAEGLILCEGFTSFREAAVALRVWRWMTYTVPDRWVTVERVRSLRMPVLVVHSDGDELFPLSMARRVAEACGERGDLMVAHGLSHNAPIFAPTREYWGRVVEWMERQCDRSRGEGEDSRSRMQEVSMGPRDSPSEQRA